MNSQDSIFVGGLIVIFMAALMIGTLMMAFGEQYIPNLTKSEWEQYRLTELCYAMQDDFTIELLDEFCRTSYGDLDNIYGDKIK